MENKDFDKIFAHKFNQIPGEPYHEEGWSDLSGRMDAHGRRRWMLPVLLPLFALLTAGNVFWWYQWREAAQRDNQGSGNVTTLLQSDTIVQATVVYRYDTIYQNITLVRRYGIGETTTSKLATQTNTSDIASDTPAAQQQSAAGIAPVTTEKEASKTQVNQEEKNAQGADNKQDIAKTNTEQDHTASHQPTSVDTASQITGTHVDSTLFAADSMAALQPVQQMIPKLSTPFFTFGRPRLNISAGWGNPLLEHKRSGYLLGAGLGADMEIMRNIRLGADVHYWNGALEADETEELLGVEIPNPGSDYKLKYWEAYQLPTVTYSFYLRYQIPLKKAWTSWFGLGTQGVTYLPYNIEFDFENQNNELEIYLPGQAITVTHWHGVTGMAGIEKQIGLHFSLGAEAWLLRHIGKKPGILDNQIGLKTRLYYRF